MDGDCTLYSSIGGNLLMDAFHNLSLRCVDSPSPVLLSPSNFFVQLLRVSMSLVMIVTLLAVYNTVSVMDRHILNTATCSLYWVFMALMITLKSAVLMVFPVLSWHFDKGSDDDSVVVVASSNCTVLSQHKLNSSGFVVQAFLQSAAVFLLFLALDHERQFRSSDFAKVNTPSKHCMAMSCTFKVFLSWPRVIAFITTLLPLLLLIAIEVYFSLQEVAPTPLVWVYMVTLLFTRVGALIMGVFMVVQKRVKLSLTIPAKIYLMVGLSLSIAEDLPNIIFTPPQSDCLPIHMSIYDLFQLVGATSLILFVLFIRSQYIRVEHESRLSLMMDLQKLLQVNGRKDIIRRYT